MDRLRVSTGSFLRASEHAPGGFLVTDAGPVDLHGAQLMPFARELVLHRSFVADEARAWTGRPEPFRWEQIEPFLTALVANGVLALES
jgi:hypothetical protein